MILHACPKCRTSGFYKVALGQQVNCHSCASSFVLTKFTRVEKDRLTRFVEETRQRASALRMSRQLVWAGCAVIGVVLVWAASSVFGLIPDEYRMVNRRFASVQNQGNLGQAVGLVAVGRKDSNEKSGFEKYFTCVGVSNDGFMVTSRLVAEEFVLGNQVWVFVDGKRLDASLVGMDKIDDFALLKVNDRLRLRFPIAKPGDTVPLNVDVSAIGYGKLEGEIRSPTDWPVAVKHGSVSRVFSNEEGSQWIEHGAPLSEGDRGGPLIYDDVLIGINIDSRSGITRALAMGPFRQKITTMISDWEKTETRHAGGTP